MNADEAAFALMVKQSIAQNPAWVRTAMAAVQSGVMEALEEQAKDRIEWEIIAVNAMHTRLFKGNKGWLADKIEALAPRASVRWADVIERLRK